jgi:hypothetical protein
MPMRRGRRPLKQWCYVGLFGADFMLCAGQVRIGPVPQSFWAVWNRRTGLLDTETLSVRNGRISVDPERVAVNSGSTRIEVSLTPTGRPVEVISPHGSAYIWTRKTPVRAYGHLTSGMEAQPIRVDGIVDESAGYHARQTNWEWSAGVGVSADGAPVTWNLVRGVHDAETMSERTVWLDGRATEVPPVSFATDLDELWGTDGTHLYFEQESVRARSDHYGIIRSDYVQPFGRFRGTLPGGVEISSHEGAFGVMERHSALW